MMIIPSSRVKNTLNIMIEAGLCALVAWPMLKLIARVSKFVALIMGVSILYLLTESRVNGQQNG